MNTLCTSVWKNRGSCIIFDKLTLGELLAKNKALSLRSALSWYNEIPSEPPSPSLVIYGLQTMLEILSPQEAEDFLLYRIRPLIIQLQNDWPACGIIFAFTASGKAFAVDEKDDELYYIRNGKERIALSKAMWGAGSVINLTCLLKSAPNGKEEKIGYYVARIS